MEQAAAAVLEAKPREQVRFYELDSLRGVATLLIVCAHIDLRPLFWAWSLMDMFFVMSSFLLTRIVYRQCTDVHGVIAFYGRRIERIWPLYFLTVIGLLCVTVLINVHRGFAVFDLTVFVRLFSFSQYSEMMFHVGPSYDYLPFARHLWSLAVEEQFYVLLPLAMLLLRRTPVWLWCGVLAIVIALAISQRAANPNMLILTSHADAFALGSVLAVSFNKLSDMSRWTGPLLLVIAAISLVPFLTYVFDGYVALLAGGAVPGYDADAATASTLFWTAVIGLLALYRGKARLSFFRLPALIHAGRLSYAIYLVHYPILRLLPLPVTRWFPGITLPYAIAICLLMVWLLAELLYRAIDRPLQMKRPTNLRGMIVSAPADR